MAKDKITEYDSNAANNTVVGDVNLAENSALPSDMNNAVREVMSHQKEAFGSGTPLYVDQTNNRLGVGTASPSVPLSISSADNIVASFESTDAVQWIAMQDSDTSSSTHVMLGAIGDDLRFRAGNNEVGRWLSSGGLTFNGDTATANALDDYEEGSWTPSSTGTATYIEQFGRYRKVGDVVYIMFILEINNIGTGEQTRISGLPFAAARECTIHASKFENINLSIVDGTLRTSGTYLYLTHRTAAAASSTSNSGFLKNNARVQASGWYHVS